LSACSVPHRPPASKRSHLRTPGTLRFVRSMRSRNGALRGQRHWVRYGVRVSSPARNEG
jgi:hypothetical protein